MFRIEMLPAAHGDALWIEYGAGGTIHRLLVDGGTPGAYPAIKARIEKLKAEGGLPRFELLVVTHVDADHIGGALALVEKKELGATFDDIWFNGYGHLTDAPFEPFGAVQGERLTAALLDGLKWNNAFNHGPVRIGADGSPVTKTLGGGMQLTLLSPNAGKLADLKPKWEKECQKAGLDPNVSVVPEPPPPGLEPMGPIDVDALVAQPFQEDAAEANGSSIAMLAEFEGKRVLLGADAHPSLLVASIDRLTAAGDKLKLAACKLPHHGSTRNVSPALIEKLDCPLYLVSTSGAQFHHPDRSAIARAVRLAPGAVRMVFNYVSEFNQVWDDDALRAQEGYVTEYPGPGQSGMVVDL